MLVAVDEVRAISRCSSAWCCSQWTAVGDVGQVLVGLALVVRERVDEVEGVAKRGLVAVPSLAVRVLHSD